jgi:hypothetical protein
VSFKSKILVFWTFHGNGLGYEKSDHTIGYSWTSMYSEQEWDVRNRFLDGYGTVLLGLSWLNSGILEFLGPQFELLKIEVYHWIELIDLY